MIYSVKTDTNEIAKQLIDMLISLNYRWAFPKRDGYFPDDTVRYIFLEPSSGKLYYASEEIISHINAYVSISIADLLCGNIKPFIK